MFKKHSKETLKKEIMNFVFVIFGNIILAFGTAIFLTKLEIIAGGLSGVGIIIQHFAGAHVLGGQLIDIVVLVLSVILWFFGLIFVGKEFAFKTLLSTLIYPLALALFLRVPVFDKLANVIAYYPATELQEGGVAVSNVLLCGLFGGVFVGAGVALTFIGGGSTGGLDIVIAIVSKYVNIKESIVSFALDGTIILVGMFVLPNNVVPGLIGMFSAFVTAMCIEIFYGSNQSSYQVDIISDKWEEISAYAQDVLGRGATIIEAKGGYKQEPRIILRVVFDKRQYNKLKEFISQTDPKAFVTFTRTNAVYGEGFKKHKEEIPASKVIKKKKK